jgi:hypothetical protein
MGFVCMCTNKGGPFWENNFPIFPCRNERLNIWLTWFIICNPILALIFAGLLFGAKQQR